MKLIRIMCRVFAVVLLIALAAPLSWQLISKQFYLTVNGHSMEPTYHVGDVLIVAPPTGDELDTRGKVVVATFGRDESGEEARYVHRVNQPLEDGKAWLKGDNNPNRDPQPVSPDQVLGTPQYVLTGMAGPIFVTLQSLPGRLSIIVIALVAWLASAKRSNTPSVRRAGNGLPCDQPDVTEGAEPSGDTAHTFPFFLESGSSK